MENIIDILVASQNLLNRMEKDDGNALDHLSKNESKIKASIKKSRDPSLYKKYLTLHNMIRQSAQEFIITGYWVYKLQPFMYYHNRDFCIEDNTLKLLIKENRVLFDGDSKNIEIQDAFYLENDHLFEKGNIPAILKELASQGDKDAIKLLQNYIENLIHLAQSTIQEDGIL